MLAISVKSLWNKDRLPLHDSYFNAFIVCDNIYVVEGRAESLENTLKWNI